MTINGASATSGAMKSCTEGHHNYCKYTKMQTRQQTFIILKRITNTATLWVSENEDK
jgi:hypothetical protein